MHFIKFSLLFLLATACSGVACSNSLNPLTESSTSTTTTPPTPTALVGRVVQQGTSTGIGSARLTLVDASGNVTTGITDVTGGFVFADLAAGTYSLQVAADGFAISESTLSFPVSSYTVQLALNGQPQGVTLLNVTVTGPDTMRVGGSAQLTATAMYSDGSRRDVSTAAKWAVAAPVIVSVSPSGVITAYASGSTTITATFAGLSGGLTLTVAGG